FKIRIKNKFMPQRVEKIIYDAVVSSNYILLEPDPEVTVEAIEGINSKFEVCCYIKDYEQKNIVEEAIWKRLWIHLYCAGIHPAQAENDAGMLNSFVSQNPMILLDCVDIFKTLEKEEKENIVKNLKVEYYKKGLPIIKQGESGQSLYIVAEGVVVINMRTDGYEEIMLERLGVGEVFGEMAFLTGELRGADVEALTDVIVFHIAEDVINLSLNKNKQFYEHLEGLLIEHKENSKLQMNKAEKINIETSESLSLKMKNKIRRIFKSN
ncbi:MAG: cyclic nucleotide-binding domain-containing protein, partial [Spirochaetales bacterium]|nr:cyclic nucleotide-binding domain-containing protein [Spirochaetales bacterium]